MLRPSAERVAGQCSRAPRIQLKTRVEHNGEPCNVAIASDLGRYHESAFGQARWSSRHARGRHSITRKSRPNKRLADMYSGYGADRSVLCAPGERFRDTAVARACARARATHVRTTRSRDACSIGAHATAARKEKPSIGIARLPVAGGFIGGFFFPFFFFFHGPAADYQPRGDQLTSMTPADNMIHFSRRAR